jgi:hypothetical protein
MAVKVKRVVYATITRKTGSEKPAEYGDDYVARLTEDGEHILFVCEGDITDPADADEFDSAFALADLEELLKALKKDHPKHQPARARKS